MQNKEKCECKTYTETPEVTFQKANQQNIFNELKMDGIKIVKEKAKKQILLTVLKS